MAEVIWSLRARQDLDGISAFIARTSPYYAQRTELGIFERASGLADRPGIGHMVQEIGDPMIREVAYKQYRIIHWLVSEHQVAILAVIHGRRKLTGKLLRNPRRSP